MLFCTINDLQVLVVTVQSLGVSALLLLSCFVSGSYFVILNSWKQPSQVLMTELQSLVSRCIFLLNV